MSRFLRIAIVALFLASFGASPALAGVGFHGGLSLSPDDFVAGIHWKAKPVAESLVFVPSVEVGFGDATMIAGNADLHYVFNSKSKLAPYAGGGLTVNWFDFDGGDETDQTGELSPNPVRHSNHLSRLALGRAEKGEGQHAVTGARTIPFPGCCSSTAISAPVRRTVWVSYDESNGC